MIGWRFPLFAFVLVVSVFLFGSVTTTAELPSSANTAAKKKPGKDRSTGGKTKGKRRGKSGHDRGKLGHGRLSKKPPKLSPEQMRRHKRKFKKVNPSYKMDSKGKPPPPSVHPTPTPTPILNWTGIAQAFHQRLDRFPADHRKQRLSIYVFERVRYPNQR